MLQYPSVGEMAIPKFAIDNGTYPYLVVLMTNKLGIKHSFETTNSVIWWKDWNRNVIVGRMEFLILVPTIMQQ